MTGGGDSVGKGGADDALEREPMRAVCRVVPKGISAQPPRPSSLTYLDSETPGTAGNAPIELHVRLTILGVSVASHSLSLLEQSSTHVHRLVA